MTREPDRFDKQAREFKARFWRIESGWDKDMDEEDIAAALRAEHASALERAAQKVPKYVVNEHQSRRLMQEIRALIPPAAAPAASPHAPYCCADAKAGGPDHSTDCPHFAPAAETWKARGAETRPTPEEVDRALRCKVLAGGGACGPCARILIADAEAKLRARAAPPVREGK